MGEHFFAGDDETTHGMPWSTSISENPSDRMEFMPFWNWQMAHMQDHLTDLEMIRVPANLTYAENNSSNNNKARVINLTFRSAECRKIRVLYYDAGSTQVYNTMWYSDESIDAPVLGISIMGFGGKRYLAMADFQPLHGDGNAELPRAFRDALIDIRGRSPTLHGKLSGRYYEGTRYFSEHILHGRFADASAVEDNILPAFQTCVSEYAALLRQTIHRKDGATWGIFRQRMTPTVGGEIRRLRCSERSLEKSGRCASSMILCSIWVRNRRNMQSFWRKETERYDILV